MVAEFNDDDIKLLIGAAEFVTKVFFAQASTYIKVRIAPAARQDYTEESRTLN
jgi:hypothetical protein